MPAYYTYTPAAPLSQFVEHLWYYEVGEVIHQQERVLPSGASQIIIDLSPQNYTGMLMGGARSEYCVIQTAWLSSVMGVSFRHGGAFPFFNLPMAELHNLDVPLDALWNLSLVNELRECLLAAPTLADRFHTLERYLVALLPTELNSHPAVDFALGAFHKAASAPGVADVTSQIGLSQRHFIQLFSQQVGLTPKRYWRVRRFQRVIRLVASVAQVDWADVAIRCGYFDQAHFIHDFRGFSGLTPTRYLAHRVDGGNHIPLPD